MRLCEHCGADFDLMNPAQNIAPHMDGSCVQRGLGPSQEMTSLVSIKASLARLEAGQMNLCSAMDLLSQGQARLMANLDEILRHCNLLGTDIENLNAELDTVLAAVHEEANRINGLAARRQDDFAELHFQNWAEAFDTKLDAGLKGTADGVALAIAELRKDLGKPREVEPLRLSDDMHTLFMDLLDELRVTRFALATRSASPLGGKARSGTKRKRASRRTRK